MLKRLSLPHKFSLLVALVFLSSIILSGIVLSSALDKQAEKDIANKSLLLMESMNSVRAYTNTQVNPILAVRAETEKKFIPESVPSYSVREVFEIMRKNPEYQNMFYKDATLNPTNMRDKADDFETEIVEKFRQDNNLKKMQGFRTLAGQKIYYTAIPIQITEPKCLRCHSTPEVAPKNLIATYGDKNGFGWKLNEIVGAQMMFIPAQDVIDVRKQYLSLTMQIFVGIFVITLIVINLLMKTIVNTLRPMVMMAQNISADNLRVTEGQEPDIKSLDKIARRSDELGQLGRVFQSMIREIFFREQRLKQQLQQLMHYQSKTKTQNNNSLDIDYLKDLQEKARNLRSKGGNREQDMGNGQEQKEIDTND